MEGRQGVQRRGMEESEGGNRVKERMESACKGSRKIVGRVEGRITK